MHSYECGGIKRAFRLEMKERSMVEIAHAMAFAHKHTNTSIFSAFKHLVYCAQHLPTFLCIPNGRIGVPT
jgi:hypothetical protein